MMILALVPSILPRLARAYCDTMVAKCWGIVCRSSGGWKQVSRNPNSNHTWKHLHPLAPQKYSSSTHQSLSPPVSHTNHPEDNAAATPIVSKNHAHVPPGNSSPPSSLEVASYRPVLYAWPRSSLTQSALVVVRRGPHSHPFKQRTAKTVKVKKRTMFHKQIQSTDRTTPRDHTTTRKPSASRRRLNRHMRGTLQLCQLSFCTRSSSPTLGWAFPRKTS